MDFTTIIVAGILIAAVFVWHVFREAKKEVDKKRKRQSVNYRQKKSKKTLQDWKDDLRVIWKDKPRTIEFTHRKDNGERTRRKVDVQKVLISSTGEYYIQGFCHNRRDLRTFNALRITTKILERSKRYDVEEWLFFKLGIED